jgi:hypothetical protein
MGRRKAARRRKASGQAVLDRFAALADRRRVPFGALLEQLLDEVGAGQR